MDVICAYWGDIVTQIKKEGQYVTWILVFAGWLISLLISFLVANWQEKKNKTRETEEKARAKAEKIVSLTQELTDRLVSLEDDAIEFWLAPSAVYLQSIDKYSRNIKIITKIAQDIDALMVRRYPTENFKNLRRAITLYPGGEILPEDYQGLRIQTIRYECTSIRNHYK